MKTLVTVNGWHITAVVSGRSRVFLISGNRLNILVDTGPKRSWNKLKRRLKRLGIESIDYLILTHAHFDHSSNAAKIRREFGARVVGNINEAHLLINGENAPIKGSYHILELIVRLLSAFFVRKLRYEPCKPDIITGKFFQFSGNIQGINVIHTPGHSEGSQSIIIDDEIALTGDTMFGILPWSVFPPFALDIPELVKSWGILLKTRCRLFLPSHGTEINREIVEKEFRKRAGYNKDTS